MTIIRPLEVELRKLGHTLGLTDKVDYLGMTAQAKLPDLYRRATLLIAPFVIAADGDQEGLGLVIVEAMGCGCPVLASDLPAVHDVIEHGVTGWLVSSGDKTNLSQAIIQLLTDIQLREALSAKALPKVKQKCSWNIIAAEYANVLRQTASALQ